MRGLAHEGEGYVPGLPGFCKPLQVRGLGSAVAGKELLLPLHDALQECARLQRLVSWNWIVYRPPAVQAEVVTFQSRRHLNATVAGDAVEVVLVALIAAPKAAIEPETGLDRS